MTKFGLYMEEKTEPEWRQHYVRYTLLKQILKEIVERTEDATNRAAGGGNVAATPPKDLTHLSLTFEEIRPGSSAKNGGRAVTESTFFEALDDDMDKVRAFVEGTLARLKARVVELEAEIEEAARWDSRCHDDQKKT